MTKIIKYQEDIEALLDDDQRAVWLNADQIAELLSMTKRNVQLHVANWKKADPDAASKGVKDFFIPSAGGEQRVPHYSVDFLIYIAYRMNRDEVNERVLAFRRWVASIVDRYLRGDLRQAEKHAYESVRDFIAGMADYDPKSETAQRYFATVQNKLLYAVTLHTAPELIKARANHAAPNMGLQTWRGQSITQADALVAKNYLSTDELQELSGLVQTIAFAFKRYSAKRATMAQWEGYIDAQIELALMHALVGKGRCSRESAESHAKREYASFKRQLTGGAA